MNAQLNRRERERAAYKEQTKDILTVRELWDWLGTVPDYISRPLIHSLEQMTKSIRQGTKWIDCEELKRRRASEMRRVPLSAKLDDPMIFASLVVRTHEYMKGHDCQPETQDVLSALYENHLERRR